MTALEKALAGSNADLERYLQAVPPNAFRADVAALCAAQQADRPEPTGPPVHPVAGA